MVEGVPEIFRVGKKNVYTSDWKELAQDNAMITLYGCSDQTLSGCFLTSETLYSDNLGTTANVLPGDNNYYKSLDIDFDLVVNKAVTLKGTMISSIPMATNTTFTGNSRCYAHVYLRKVSDGVESHIISGATAILLTSFDRVRTREPLLLCKMTVPQTLFRKGDTIRVTIEGWGEVDAGKTGGIGISYDPKNRDNSGMLVGATQRIFESTDVTQLTINLPLKIDL